MRVSVVARVNKRSILNYIVNAKNFFEAEILVKDIIKEKHGTTDINIVALRDANKIDNEWGT
jgi:hypothetical protein